MATNRRRSRRSSARPQTNVQPAEAVDTQMAVAGDAGEQFDWHQEYAYVLSDLRTLLIVSGLLFGGIVVLAFFL